jgi:hypothetical protein
MALDQSTMTMQKLVFAISQLSEQLSVTKASKSNMDISDVIKAINSNLKSTKGDLSELKNLSKILKNSPNAKHFDHLQKTLDILIKSFTNPDIKHMKQVGISVDNLVAEFAKLDEHLKTINVARNEKANLSVLSQAVTDGYKNYATLGFGKQANDFYKRATLDELKFLKNMDKNIMEGNKISQKESLKDKIKKTADKNKGSLGLLTAGADAILKGMGFGTLPGEFIEMFGNIAKSMDESKKAKEDEKIEKDSLATQGLLESKEKAQLSLDTNKKIQERAIDVKDKASNAQSGLSIELSKAIAGAMKTSEHGIDDRFKLEGQEGEADISKISEAVISGTLTRDDIEKIISSSKLSKDENGNEDRTIVDTLLKNLDEVDEYSNIIKEQQNTIRETGEVIQGSIETISEIFVELRDTVGKVLKARIEDSNKEIDKKFGKKYSKEQVAGLKERAKNMIIEDEMKHSKVSEDEMHGIIGGQDRSRHMEEYERQAGEGFANNGKTENAKVTEAWKEESFRNAIDSKNPTNKDEAILEKIAKTTSELDKDNALTKLKEANISPPEVPVPSDLAQKEATMESVEDESDEDGMSLDDVHGVFQDAMIEFLKKFEETLKAEAKEKDESAKKLIDLLKNGEAKFKMVNVGDIKLPGGGNGGGGGGGGTESDNPRFQQ